MTEQTSQTQPTETSTVFPERAIRQAFPSWDDQKTIQQSFSGMTPQRQAEFVKAVEGSDPGGLTGLVAGFLDSGSAPDAGGTVPSPRREGEGDTQPPADPGNDGSSEPTGGEPANAGDAELEEALDTIETAEDYADANPDRIDALLAAERLGKARKTLIEKLEVAQRRRDREAKAGE